MPFLLKPSQVHTLESAGKHRSESPVGTRLVLVLELVLELVFICIQVHACVYMSVLRVYTSVLLGSTSTRLEQSMT